MSENRIFKSLSEVGGAIGRGLIAGFAGTVAITVSQMIEMQITGREQSSAPAKVGGKALGVEARGKAELEVSKVEEGAHRRETQLEEKVEANKDRFSQIMHLSYGTSWGICRGALDLAGIKGAPATMLHFGAIWGAALIMLPAAGASKPITKWSAEQITTDVLHHAIYAIAAGAVYDAMPKDQ